MPNASDIITFIGVPLAVLGVLPILYTAINSILTLQSIKRKLRSNGVKTLSTANSLMSGIVEITLPRYSITPLDRDKDAEYWMVNNTASNLKGGTWTLFNWNTLITGSKTYRLQYSGDLQLPQAEISLEDLFSILLDRGAVPDVRGLRLFRLSGLWTPVGTSLMLSPDTTRSALKVSLPEDSEGVVSLSLSWDSAWDSFRPGGLGPGWMRINNVRDDDVERTKELESKRSVKNEAKNQSENFVGDKTDKDLIPVMSNSRSDAKSLRLRFSHTGRALTVSKAIWEQGNEQEECIDLTHLDLKPASIWIPAIALSLGIWKSMPLYNHNLDESFQPLATRDTVPCGVLVMFGILDEADAPSWETKYDSRESMFEYKNTVVEHQRAIAAESKMSPAEAEVARRNRMEANMRRQAEDARKRLQRENDRRLQRAREAIASARLGVPAVAEAALKWLKTKKCIPTDGDLISVAEALLVNLLQNNEEAMKVCQVLECWQKWTSRGGMNNEDLEFLSERTEAFCRAACIMGLLRDVFAKEESTIAVDMRECVQYWKRVRLG